MQPVAGTMPAAAHRTHQQLLHACKPVERKQWHAELGITPQAPELPNQPNRPLLCLPRLTSAHFEKGPSFSFMSGLQDQRMREGAGHLGQKVRASTPRTRPPKPCTDCLTACPLAENSPKVGYPKGQNARPLPRGSHALPRPTHLSHWLLGNEVSPPAMCGEERTHQCTISKTWIQAAA